MFNIRFAITCLFQPTRPLRGATFSYSCTMSVALIFQPTRPLRGATEKLTEMLPTFLISTHAPLAGRDVLVMMCSSFLQNISTHAPLAGRDVEADNIAVDIIISTHAPLAGRDAPR